MKKILFSIMAGLSILFASCDKIEEGNYIVFSGQTATWYDGNGVADHSQRALIEKFTGPRCPNCPTADGVITAALASNEGRLIAVSIHDSSTFGKPYEGSPDLRTADGDTWSQYFGIRAAGLYPTAMINRMKNGGNWNIVDPTGSIDGDLNRALNETPSIAIAVDAVYNESSNNVSITANLEWLQNISSDLTLTLLLIEDGITAEQMQPDRSHDENYTHNHILRDVITDVWGFDVDKGTGTAGTKKMAQFQYTPENVVNSIENCHIIAFVSNKENRTILNVAECDL